MNRTFFGYGGAGDLNSTSEYSSSEYDSDRSDLSVGKSSQYKKSLDFLVE